MAHAQAEELKNVGLGFMTKVFYVCLALVLLTAAISFGGRFFGHSISMGGHTDSAAPREVVIGNNVISAPENMIRFPDARRDGVTSRLDLYMRWPMLDGYSDAASADFNHANGSRKIIFLTFEDKSMSRDMSGRYEPIYRELIEPIGRPGPAKLTLHDFSAKSGYMSEMLAVAYRPGQDPFVARCLTGDVAAQSLAPCERDIQLGDNLSLTFRFPEELLKDWRGLESAIRARAVAMLQTARD